MSANSNAEQWSALHSPGARLVGYRVLRRIGRGRRSEVYLAHASDGAPVVVKEFAADVATPLLEPEIAAYAGAGRHVPRLLDLSFHADRRVAVVEFVDGGGLPRRLEGTGGLRPEAAVTVLIGVARALDDLHGRGIAHEGVTGASIAFDRAGRPVLLGLGAARCRPVGDRALIDDAVAGDFGALDALAEALLPGTRFVARARVVDPELLQVGYSRARLLDGVEERLFALAEPGPIDADGAVAAPPTGRGQPRRPGTLATASPQRECRARPRHARRRGQGWLARADELLRRAGALCSRDAARRGWSRLTPRRRRVTIGAGAVSLGLALVAFAALPTTTGSTPGDHRADPVAPSSAPPDGTPAPSPVAESSGVGTVSAGGAPSGDDPVAATRRLLALRGDCLRRASAACLRTVDEVPSPLVEDDEALLESGADVTEGVRMGSGTATLIDRSGATALVDYDPGDRGDEVTVLLIETDSGWRLRGVYSAGAGRR